MKQKIARFRMSDFLLKQALHMPEDAEIVFIKKCNFNEIEIDVIHKDLKEIETFEGGEPPLITPRISRIPESYKFDWNQK